MKLWLLKRRSECGYDETSGFVIRAETATYARLMAATKEQAGDEGPETWIDPALSTCKLLKSEGKSGIILRDFIAG